MNNAARLASVIGLTLFLMFSKAHGASFIIELKNGRELTTSHLWEEGNEIKFYASQGTAGVPKAFVRRIKASTLTYNDKVSRNSTLTSGSDARVSTRISTMDKETYTDVSREMKIQQEDKSSESSQAQPYDGAKDFGAGDAQLYRANKQMLMSELEAARNRYLAASGAKNPEAKKAALEEMRTYSKKILDLRDEIKSENGGVLPTWWDE